MNVMACKFIRNYIKGNVVLKCVSISKSLNSGTESFHMSFNVGKKSLNHVDDSSVVVAIIQLMLNHL